MLWKDHIIFKEFYAGKFGENWRYKKRLGYTLKNEETNFWFDTQKCFLSIETFSKNRGNGSPKTLLLLDTVFVLSINVNKNEIFKQNLFVWNLQIKILGLVGYIL